MQSAANLERSATCRALGPHMRAIELEAAAPQGESGSAAFARAAAGIIGAGDKRLRASLPPATLSPDRHCRLGQ